MAYETFRVDCPGCGDPKGPYTTLMRAAGRSCACGTVFTIDPDARAVDEILES